MKSIIEYLGDVRTLIIIVLVIVILCMGFCRGKCPDAQVVSDTIKITLPGDSFPVEKIVPKPYPVKVIERVPEYMEVDTFAILADYFKENTYDLTLRDDTSALIKYKVTVWQNELYDGILTFQNRRPWNITQVSQNVVQERKFKFFVGLRVGGWKDRFSLAPGVLFQYRNFLAGVDFDVVNSEVSVPIYYKISFRKK